jgi:hypothetical protein
MDCEDITLRNKKNVDVTFSAHDTSMEPRLKSCLSGKKTSCAVYSMFRGINFLFVIHILYIVEHHIDNTK